jgi:hypothetical protein
MENIKPTLERYMSQVVSKARAAPARALTLQFSSAPQLDSGRARHGAAEKPPCTIDGCAF